MEVWKPIPGYESRYEVSNLGRIKSLKFSRTLKPFLNKRWGVFYIDLWGSNGKRKAIKVHRLVLLAFHGPCPEGMEGCHNNGNALDNRENNLRWDTRLSNARDMVNHGHSHKGERSPLAKLKAAEVLAIRKDTRPYADIAANYGISRPHVSTIKHRKTWKHI